MTKIYENQDEFKRDRMAVSEFVEWTYSLPELTRMAANSAIVLEIDKVIQDLFPQSSITADNILDPCPKYLLAQTKILAEAIKRVAKLGIKPNSQLDGISVHQLDDNGTEISCTTIDDPFKAC